MESMIILHEVGCQVQENTRDDMAFTYFIQWLSAAVQQDNAASVMGTAMGDCSTIFLEYNFLYYF